MTLMANFRSEVKILSSPTLRNIVKNTGKVTSCGNGNQCLGGNDCRRHWHRRL